MKSRQAVALLVCGSLLGCAPAQVKLAVPEPLPSLGMPIAPGISLHLGDQPPAQPDSMFYVFRSTTDSILVRGYLLRGLFVRGMAFVYTDWWQEKINDIVVEFQQPVTREDVVATLAEEIGSGPQQFNSLPDSDVSWFGSEYIELRVTEGGDGNYSLLRATLTWQPRLIGCMVGQWLPGPTGPLAMRACVEGNIALC